MNSGLCRGRHALVTEVAVDLEDALETADHQTLEVQLRGDTQEHRHVQRVVMGLERLGRGTTRNGLQHRRFHFEEITLAEELTNMGDHLGTHAEGLAHLLVHDQVHIALTVTLFGIGQAVELVRQRAQRLGQQAHVGHFHVKIALAGTGQGAFGGEDVARVPGFHRFQRLGRQGLAVDVDLNATGHVLQDHERAAVEHQATGQP